MKIGRLISLAMVVAAILWLSPSPGVTQSSPTVRAALTGFQETPAISTGASGSFVAQIRGDAIDYELSYADLESAVTQAHIHFGQPGVAGGISVWLCSNLASPPTPAGTQSCPTPSGTVSGTIVASNVVGPAGQGIAAGEFSELVRAIINGVAYANVHSTTFPSGEIRGQIRGTNFPGTGP